MEFTQNGLHSPKAMKIAKLIPIIVGVDVKPSVKNKAIKVRAPVQTLMDNQPA